MPSYCFRCGTAQVEDASYCHKCGRPHEDAIAAATYEFCRIEETEHKFRFGRGTFSKWAADATGPSGIRNVALSPEWNAQDGDKETRRRTALHADIVKELVSSGWERNPSGDGSKWFQLAFRRRVAS